MPKELKKDKTITLYMPAGMTFKSETVREHLNSNDLEWSKITPSKKSERKNEPSAIMPPKSHGNTNTQSPISPPKTICKNRSLPIEDFEKIPTYFSSDTAESSSNETDFDLTSPESSPETDSSLSSTENAQELKESENRKPAGLSFKDKLAERLKKNARKREQAQKTEKNTKQNCNCGNCDDFFNCLEWLTANVNFDHPPTSTSKKQLPFLKNNFDEKEVNILRMFNNKIIVHGQIIPKPVFSPDKTSLNQNIQKTLIKMNCTSAKAIQSYIWITVQRGLNAFVIGGPKSGKTLSYLPGFCSFVLEKNERYKILQKYEGPLAVILCSNSKSCQEVKKLADLLMEECWGEDSAEVLALDSASVQCHNCDLLITTPAILEENLKLQKVKLKRLCHLALEEGHLLLKNHAQSVKKILKVLNSLQINRRQKNIQLVLTSEKWTVDLETLLKKLYTPPLVCFEDFLEAAVYAKVEFIKKRLQSLHKLFYLDDILKKYYMTSRTVVFCTQDEIRGIKEHLEISGIECIMLSNDEDELCENEDMWRALPSGQYKVLLCTDSLFEKTVHILNANRVVHFSLPSDWPKFEKRFRCLSANLPSPFDKTEQVYTQKCSFLLFDETCDNQIATDFFDVLTRNVKRHIDLN